MAIKIKPGEQKDVTTYDKKLGEWVTHSIKNTGNLDIYIGDEPTNAGRTSDGKEKKGEIYEQQRDGKNQ